MQIYSIYDIKKEKQQIVTFEKLKPENIWRWTKIAINWLIVSALLQGFYVKRLSPGLYFRPGTPFISCKRFLFIVWGLYVTTMIDSTTTVRNDMFFAHT